MVTPPPQFLAAGGGPIGVVSGSGINLRSLLDEIYGECSFDEALGGGGTGVAGHDGVFLFGRCGDVPVVLQSGRIHLYEGHPPKRVAATVSWLHRCGVKKLVLTNAVGGLDPQLRPGNLVAAREVKTWPYTPHSLPECLEPAVTVPGCDAEGTYIWMHGPCYETRAEIRALQAMGGITVGMSLPIELEQCRVLGIAAGVVSCVTNDCTRVGVALTHQEVVDTAKNASARLATILRDWIGGKAIETGERPDSSS